MSQSTVLSIPAYTTTVVMTSKTPEAEMPSSAAQTPVYSASVPAVAPSQAPYPSTNGTAPASASATAPQGTATGYPTSTKSSTVSLVG